MHIRAPAEWETHEKTWMGWPRRADTWRDGAVPARKAFAAVAREICKFEPVSIAVNPGDTIAPWIEPGKSTVETVVIPHDDSWFRDTGPMFVERDGRLVGLDWDFNAWGGLYEPYDADRTVARTILAMEDVCRFEHGIVLEGGSVHVDGEGTMLTTEECLLHPSRNPGLTKDEIEAKLKDAFGVKVVIWLPKGLVGDDDTNGHIDNIACFAEPGKVLLAWTDDANDPQHAVSSEAFDVLSRVVDARGRRLEIVKLPLPPPQYRTEEEVVGTRTAGDRLAASYVNFYIVNGGVIMPAFGVKESDDRAQKILQSVFPDRVVVPVQSREILLGGGNIHCITMQQPRKFYV